MSKRFQVGQVFVRNGRYVGRFRTDVVGDRKRRAVVLGFKGQMTKQDARRKLLEIIHGEGVNTEAHLERSLKPALTFSKVADSWIDKHLPTLKLSTQHSAPKLIKKHLRPFFGARPIEEIKTGTVNDWIARLNREGLQPKTVHNMWKMFRGMMNWHAQQNDVQPRKWYPTLPKENMQEQRWFSQEEVRQLVQAAKGQYKVLFLLAAFSGLRAGELFGLRVEDVDLRRNLLRVRRSIWRGIEVTPKNGKSREVRIDSGTALALSQYLGVRTSGRVFQTKDGNPLADHNVVRQNLKPLCRTLGIPEGGLHAFRHGRVSHSRQTGVPAEFIKRQVGHSSLRTTDGYTHFSEQQQREIIEGLAPSWTHSISLDSVAVDAKAQ
jgi:integrase